MASQHSELSDFQKKKLMMVFNTFFAPSPGRSLWICTYSYNLTCKKGAANVNRDGLIEKEDFELAIQKIDSMRNWSSDCTEHKVAQETLLGIWELLRSMADANNDDRVTKAEWFEMWTDCVNKYKEGNGTINPDHMPEWERKYMEFMYDVNDITGDGYIDETEFTTVYKSYGYKETECKNAYAQLTNHGQMRLDMKNYCMLWNQYFLGNDKNSPGNWIFCGHV